METLTREQKRMALAGFRMDDIGPNGDPWGTGMSHMLAIADTLSHVDDVPWHWGFSHGMHDGCLERIIECGQETQHDDCQCDWTQVGYVNFIDGEIGIRMLAYAGNVINRYLDWVRRAGRDY
jgi:hypothetical protein